MFVLHACMQVYTAHVFLVLVEAGRRHLIPLGLELQTDEICHVGAGTCGPLDLLASALKISQCSWQLSHLSAPRPSVVMQVDTTYHSWPFNETIPWMYPNHIVLTVSFADRRRKRERSKRDSWYQGGTEGGNHKKDLRVGGQFCLIKNAANLGTLNRN